MEKNGRRIDFDPLEKKWTNKWEEWPKMGQKWCFRTIPPFFGYPSPSFLSRMGPNSKVQPFCPKWVCTSPAGSHPRVLQRFPSAEFSFCWLASALARCSQHGFSSFGMARQANTLGDRHLWHYCATDNVYFQNSVDTIFEEPHLSRKCFWPGIYSWRVGGQVNVM